MKLRPALQEFAEAQEVSLSANDHKQPWGDLTADLLASKMRSAAQRLSDAVCCNELGDIVKYTIDLSNYSMMLHHNAKARMSLRGEKDEN